ncbi:BTB/POZ and MATH domain-containing protein 3-like [Papaver somniferum]|uniref:BTB/POZ and MATH domain-containing protein 3-like n=1 Tax=Papaver somniferum TaxID=3469 RepID=UPI000E6F6C47|nr:BTB/POZ and MATH domain-containing protein 3-like [Papaver somniferum]
MYMKRSELETSNYLKDDRLSIHGTVSIVQTHFEEGKRYVIPVSPSDMIQNLRRLLKSEIGSDITFQVAGEEFRAHKSILAARSPVFKSMFFGLVGNRDMETTVVEEFDPFAFKVMLLFLYSDELPETHELCDSDSPCTSTKIMRHLLTAADCYNLARLRQMCEAKLYEDIAVNTVADTLALT